MIDSIFCSLTQLQDKTLQVGVTVVKLNGYWLNGNWFIDSCIHKLNYLLLGELFTSFAVVHRFFPES